MSTINPIVGSFTNQQTPIPVSRGRLILPSTPATTVGAAGSLHGPSALDFCSACVSCDAQTSECCWRRSDAAPGGCQLWSCNHVTSHRFSTTKTWCSSINNAYSIIHLYSHQKPSENMDSTFFWLLLLEETSGIAWTMLLIQENIRRFR